MRLRDAWRRSPSRTMPGKINVLFLHSQTGFGADSTIHSHLMRHLDRDRFTVHVAVSPGDGPDGSLALSRLREIPDVRVRPTHFAPGFHHRSGAEILRGVRSAAPPRGPSAMPTPYSPFRASSPRRSWPRARRRPESIRS
jgi:hypothetical protein